MKMSWLQRRYINRPENIEKTIPFLEELISKIEPAGIERALEVGCGPGYMSAALSEKCGIEVVGVDVDPAEVRFAAESLQGRQGLSFVEADVTALPFGDGEFDLVMSMMVFHHISNWQDAVSEVARVLRTGGYFLWHDLTYSWLLKTLFKPVMRSHAFYDIEEVVSCMEAQGMQLIFRSPPNKYFYDQFTQYNMVFKRY